MVNLSTIQSPLLVQSYRSRNKSDDSGRAIASVYVEKIEFHLTPYLYIIFKKCCDITHSFNTFIIQTAI